MDKSTAAKWDLSFYYDSFQDARIPQDMAEYQRKTEELKELAKGEDSSMTHKLETIFALTEEINKLRESLQGYVFLTLAVDAENEDAAKLMNRVQLLDNDYSIAYSDVKRLVGSIENLEDVISASPMLTEIGFALREMRSGSQHMIDSTIQPWLLEMSISGGSAFSQLRDKLDATLTVDYDGEKMSLSQVRSLAYSPDREVRRKAYNAEIASYSKVEIPMSYCLNAVKHEARTMAKAKNYPSVLDMTLAESRMDRETLDAMFTAINEYLPHFRRYMQAKGKLLGDKNGLPFYDLFAPIGESTREYTIEEAREMLVRDMGKFTPEMGKFIDNAFAERWIDIYPRHGKSGGAFCDSVHSHNRSVVMTNFGSGEFAKGSFSDVSTLAHELGHGWHNHCMDGLPYIMTHAPMPLAETASIFNETLLSHLAVQESTDDDFNMAVLESSIMEANQTVVDISSRYLFETKVVDTCDDHFMTVEELKSAMVEAQKATYGDGLDGVTYHPYMWACKSHYYSPEVNFYNFPYAFGLLFGKGLFSIYQEKGEAFVPEYCRILRSCGSGTIPQVAASAGIDVRNPDFWRSSLETIKQDIDKFVEMVDNRIR